MALNHPVPSPLPVAFSLLLALACARQPGPVEIAASEGETAETGSTVEVQRPCPAEELESIWLDPFGELDANLDELRALTTSDKSIMLTRTHLCQPEIQFFR